MVVVVGRVVSVDDLTKSYLADPPRKIRVDQFLRERHTTSSKNLVHKILTDWQLCLYSFKEQCFCIILFCRYVHKIHVTKIELVVVIYMQPFYGLERRKTYICIWCIFLDGTYHDQCFWMALIICKLQPIGNKIVVYFKKSNSHVLRPKPITGTLLNKQFFQILWKSKSRCNILVSFPSYLKKLRSTLRFWLEKLNCGFFHSFHSRKNTTKQLFQSKFQCRK